MSALRAPRSLKLPVRCRISSLQKISAPHSSESGADRVQGVLLDAARDAGTGGDNIFQR